MRRLSLPVFCFSLLIAFAVSAGPPGGWGKLEYRTQEHDTVWVVTVSGTPYEMGYHYGRLLAPQVAANLTHFMQVASNVMNPALLSVAARALRPYVPARYLQMMRGLADACADYGHPEVDMTLLYRMMAVPDLSESGCSLFAASRPATNGHTYQMRNLDWYMTTGLQRYPVVAVFLPTDTLGTPQPQPHATVGFAGVFGAIGGLNASGLAVSEIAGFFHDREVLAGEPMLYLLWDVLWDATTVAEAESLILGAHRTNMYYYAVSDPGSQGPRTRLFFTGYDSAFSQPDGQPVHRSYLQADTAFYEPLAGAVYWKNHDGSGNRLLYNELSSRYGVLDDAGAIAIARAAGVPATLVSVITDGTDRELYVSFAKGEHTPAHVRDYVYLDLKRYFEMQTTTVALETGGESRRADAPGLAIAPNPFNDSAVLAYDLGNAPRG
ncbi:MAG TPA: hypothetical protein ENK07_02365, partial [Bacteroidetes bacterium]|nr:hypothetical protein [Bacteroidota bacterium]